jgi:hypothetical protein
MTSSKLATRMIGVDVAKDKLDVCDSEGKIRKEIQNSTTSVVKHIVKKIKTPGEAFVVCEATGGYERTLVAAPFFLCSTWHARGRPTWRSFRSQDQTAWPYATPACRYLATGCVGGSLRESSGWWMYEVVRSC